MNVEQRLVDALRSTDRVEPSRDLWTRVVHSIEEDRAHRRRVRTSIAAALTTVVGLSLIALLAVVDGPEGRHVRPGVLELLETVALAVLVGVLGPAIRRFGRHYAEDLWPAEPTTAAALLRLLDVAYVLILGGYLLLTVDLSLRTGSTPLECLLADTSCPTIGAQLEAVAARVGGLLLAVGVLHGVTIAVLPVVALISNSTRVGRRLPRWLFVILVVGAVWAGFQVFGALLGLLIGAAGS